MNEYKTTDIVLAAYLKVKGFKMQGIERQGNRGTFIFIDIKSTNISDYDLGLAVVEPKSLASEIRSLTTAARR